MHRIVLALTFALFSQLAAAAVNLNTATVEDLVALPGIGPSKAQAIIDHRKANGPFKSVEELKDVKGIGAKRFEIIKGELTVAPGPVKSAAAPPKADPRPTPMEKSEAKAAPAAKGDIKGVVHAEPGAKK